MKVLNKSALALAIIGLIIFVNCGPGGGSDDNPPNPFITQSQLFTGNWTIATDGALLEGVPEAGYDGMTLNVTGDENGGTITATGAGSATVWPASSGWQFSSSGGDTSSPAAQYVLRNADMVVMGVTVTNDILELTFLIPETAVRASGISGNWTFRFESSGGN